jgi:ABC-type polysaccharide/polyol phosphate transport system ATPase subunit
LEDVAVRFRAHAHRAATWKDWAVQRTRRQEVAPSRDFYALKDVSLALSSGDRLGIVGLNGAGKTTLLKAIAGIYPPQRGRIRVSGTLTPLLELGTGFDPEQTGRENIYLNGAMFGLTPRDMMAREEEIIEFSELTDSIDMPVKYYSSGMQGRLAFSIAAALQPQILLIDEIFATGDAHFVAKASARMLAVIDRSQIVLFASHNLEQIKSLCNRAIVLRKGEVVHEGAPGSAVDLYLNEIVPKA